MESSVKIANMGIDVAQGRQKTAQIGQKCTKWRFEGSGGLESLEHRGKPIAWTFRNSFHAGPTVQNHQKLKTITPRIGVGPGFDSEGSINFFIKYVLLSQLVLHPLGHPG